MEEQRLIIDSRCIYLGISPLAMLRILSPEAAVVRFENKRLRHGYAVGAWVCVGMVYAELEMVMKHDLPGTTAILIGLERKKTQKEN
jgi:hypothetical protein